MDFEKYAEHHRNIFDTIVMPELAAMLQVSPADFTYEPLPNRRISGASALWRGADGKRIRIAIGERQGAPNAAHTIRYHNRWQMPSEWDSLLGADYAGDLYVQAYVDKQTLVAIGIIESPVLVRTISAAMGTHADFTDVVGGLCDDKNNFHPGDSVPIGPGVSLVTTFDGQFMFIEAEWTWLKAAGASVQTWTSGVTLGHRLASPSADYTPPTWLGDAIRNAAI